MHAQVTARARAPGPPRRAAPVWYSYWPGGNITLFIGTQGRKARKTGLIEKVAVVSSCVQRAEFPYKYVTAEDTAVQADQPPSAAVMLTIARPGTELVLFTVRPDRWLAADFSDEAG